MNSEKAMTMRRAEKLVEQITFWKTPVVLEKRKNRLKIRADYKAARALYSRFFGKVRDSIPTDYIDNDTMVISKLVEVPDRVVLVNAIDVMRKYGFQLDITPVLSIYSKEKCCKIIMRPDEVISNYLTELYLFPEDVDHHLTSEKMKLKFG